MNLSYAGFRLLNGGKKPRHSLYTVFRLNVPYAGFRLLNGGQTNIFRL